MTEKCISSIEEFKETLSLGISKKIHASTNLNTNSSRSHSIFKFILRFAKTNNKIFTHNIETSYNKFGNNLSSKKLVFSEANVFANNMGENAYETCSFTIVDLAGTERTNRSEVTGKNFTETCKINLSLTTLGRCFEIMKSNVNVLGKKLIPFRESNLTKILQENFLNDHAIRMLTNINPSLADFDDTMRILNFAGITKCIITQRSRGIMIDSSVKHLSNSKYLLNGRLNPEFNTNPTKGLNLSNMSNLFGNNNINNNINIHNYTLTEFNENENDRIKLNLFNLTNLNQLNNEEQLNKNNLHIRKKKIFEFIFY